MSVTFIDGCSHYDNLLHKYDAATAGASIGITNPRRVGSRHILLDAYDDYCVTRALASSTGRVTVGCAFRVPIGEVHHVGFTMYYGATAQVSVFVNPSDGRIAVMRGDDCGVLLATSDPGLVVTGRWYYLEFGARIHNTLGSTEVRLNGSPIDALTLTGVDTEAGTSAYADRIRFFGAASFCDIVVCQSSSSVSFLGDCLVDTILPSGAGAHTDWTPSAGANYQNVDDAGVIDEDGTYNASSAAGDIDTFAFANLPSRPTSDILAVAVNLALRKDDAANRVLAAQARIGGTDYVIGTGGYATSSYMVHQKIEETNPSTSQPWEEAAVNGAEFGYLQFSVS